MLKLRTTYDEYTTYVSVCNSSQAIHSSLPTIMMSTLRTGLSLQLFLALKPDIGKAEEVCDSIKCGEDLEDAMVSRDLPLIEQAIVTIKDKSYEKDHVVQILEAEKLITKLKRLEKSKKDILELNQRTIAIIRSYSQPIPSIREVMIATYMILGYKEKELKV